MPYVVVGPSWKALASGGGDDPGYVWVVLRRRQRLLDNRDKAKVIDRVKIDMSTPDWPDKLAEAQADLEHKCSVLRAAGL